MNSTPSRLAVAASLPVKPSVSVIEKAYVRGLKEGMRRGEAQRQELLAAKNELGIRYKTVVGEVRRLRLRLHVKAVTWPRWSRIRGTKDDDA